MTLKDGTQVKGGETVVGTDKNGTPIEGVVVGGHYHRKKGFLTLAVQAENHSKLVADLPAENFLPKKEEQSTPDTGTVGGA